MANDENTDLLLGLGLTLNQAKVYLAILKLQKTTVGQVANFSKVRREDVYRILPSLEKMGLIERFLGKPTEIRATQYFGFLNFTSNGRKKQIQRTADRYEEQGPKVIPERLEAAASWRRKHLHTYSRKESNSIKNFRTD